MLFSRIFSFILRGLQFICAIITLGLSAHFIYRLNRSGPGPRGRLIYTLIWSVLSTLLSLVWMVPFTANMLHYPFDLVLSLGWWASFGALYHWISRGRTGGSSISSLQCRGIFGVWNWNGEAHDSYCTRWQTLEAFACIAAVVWLLSAVLGMCVWHRRGKSRRSYG